MIDTKGSDVCIIGAGIGGLTAGALLTKKGYKVTIFEKEALMGGRALSFNNSCSKIVSKSGSENGICKLNLVSNSL